MWEIYQVMRVITVLDNRKKTTKKISMLQKRQIMILTEKYSNFADVFSKMNANILPEHSMHNLAIKTKKEKFLFWLVYNYLKVKL